MAPEPSLVDALNLLLKNYRMHPKVNGHFVQKTSNFCRSTMVFTAYIRWLEEWYAREDDGKKIPSAMDYGLDQIGEDMDVQHPLDALLRYAERSRADSLKFFAAPKNVLFQLTEDCLTFPSPVKTETEANNTVRARVFESVPRKRAVVIMHHWNSPPGPYDRLAWWLRLAGIASVRLTLPYHEGRRPAATAVAEGMVSSNLGRTIRSIRQAVMEVRLAIRWLQYRGYRRIGLVGSSIGSCVGSLAAAHDPDVHTLVQMHTASHFGEAVWTGRATRHIRQALEGRLSLEELNALWAVISPISYVRHLQNQGVKVLVISGREDKVFLPHLTQRLLVAYQKEGVAYQYRELPCGHYTLGTLPWSPIALQMMVSFLKRSLH